MNEFKPTGAEIPPIQEFDKSTEWINELSEIDFQTELKEYAFPIEQIEGKEDSSELINEREYGLQECVEVAKDIFTREVISEWKSMSLEQRYEIVKKYSDAVASSLGIEPREVIFKSMPEYTGGYNNGDGNIYVNSNMIGDPKYVVKLIDTVAHESRHQFQREAVRNPEKFGISPEVAKEWEFGLKNYTTCDSTQYDPWGYHYNPVEVDARYFGESVVREVTKDMINYIYYDGHQEQSYDYIKSSQPMFFVNDRNWHMEAANEALARGDMSAYNDHIDSARRSTK